MLLQVFTLISYFVLIRKILEPKLILELVLYALAESRYDKFLPVRQCDFSFILLEPCISYTDHFAFVEYSFARCDDVVAICTRRASISAILASKTPPELSFHAVFIEFACHARNTECVKADFRHSVEKVARSTF